MELHDGIEGSAIEVIENAGHMVPLEAPRRLGAVISRWLDAQAAG